MIEMPAAVLMADTLGAESGFFAIGSNDLTMYTLAADRAELEATELYDPVHPAMLRLIRMTVEAASRCAIPVSVCGEMAANARYAPLLLGLGVRSLSMNATAVPRVKQAVRNARLAECEAFAAEVMAQTEPEAVAALIQRFHDRV